MVRIGQVKTLQRSSILSVQMMWNLGMIRIMTVVDPGRGSISSKTKGFSYRGKT
jgi:hypothetical protein